MVRRSAPRQTSSCSRTSRTSSPSRRARAASARAPSASTCRRAGPGRREGRAPRRRHHRPEHPDDARRGRAARRRPRTASGSFRLERHGVKCISIQFFVPEGEPIVWRGPLVGGAIQQFATSTGASFDYLIIDLPPGTSDAQLTLAQAVPLGVAPSSSRRRRRSRSATSRRRWRCSSDCRSRARRGREHDRIICPGCGSLRDLRPRRRRAVRGTARHRLLGGIPLDVTVRQGGDVGVPAVAQREPGPAARACARSRECAAHVSVRRPPPRTASRPSRSAEADGLDSRRGP